MMTTMLTYFLMFNLVLHVQVVICYECEMTARVCETSLEITHRLTMMHSQTKSAVFPHNGSLYKYNVDDVTGAPKVPVEDVITADGWETPRLVVVANGTMPGPPIIVYVGQEIVVHVSNHLKSEEVSIHWHGLPQKGTPFMDGVPFITQCPIATGQTFTYRFKAEIKGTYWYHSHVGAQRSKGLFGAFIIRENRPLEMEEHIMNIQEWNHDWDSDMEDAKMIWGFYENRNKFQSSQSSDGQFFSNVKAQGGLINGRGRFYDPDTGLHNDAPLETFRVSKDQKYRFRVINAGTLYPFTVSIDDHKLVMVATDGFDIEPVEADSFIINVGERFDFTLTANQSVGNYFIRAKTLEATRNNTAEAILRYQGAKDEAPTTTTRECTADERCLVVNCFVRYYPSNEFTDCIPIADLRVKQGHGPAPPITEGKFSEHFFNFAFPGITSFPSTVNGRQFRFPSENILADADDVDFPCELEDCGEQKQCRCTHSVSIKHGDTVQMVILNMGIGTGWAHPVHLHGHTFYVLKMGFANYNNETGKRLDGNNDIDCRGGTSKAQSFCNSATWSDPSWRGNNIPGLELNNPVMKDTVIVPSGGYVVIRIVADNPGVWFFHCHIEMHANDGMAMVINESFPLHSSPPPGFPHCHSYPDNEPLDGNVDTQTETNDSVFMTRDNFWIIVAILIGVIFVQFCAIISCWCKGTKSRAPQYEDKGKANDGFKF